MRSYEEMVEAGDWPPTNRETLRFLAGWVVGFIVGFAAAYAIWHG